MSNNQNLYKGSTTPFSMRLTASEREFLDRHAGNKPWAQYIRERVFGDVARPRQARRRTRIEDQELVAALSGLGQSNLYFNLNQLASSADIGLLDIDEETHTQLKEAAGAVLAMRCALLMALGLKPE
ncbi:MAG: hypothetical protein AAF541_06875 [Pseudomonadota bacterium]